MIQNIVLKKKKERLLAFMLRQRGEFIKEILEDNIPSEDADEEKKVMMNINVTDIDIIKSQIEQETPENLSPWWNGKREGREDTH